MLASAPSILSSTSQQPATGLPGNYMASGESADEVIRRIISILDAASIPYMLTGSFASSIHGMPRATQDIDLVIAPNPTSLEALLKNLLEDRYYVSRDAALDAYRQTSLFNVSIFSQVGKSISS